MSAYRHILLAVSFAEPESLAVTRARALAESFGARLSLLHVVDPAAVATSDTPVLLQEQAGAGSPPEQPLLEMVSFAQPSADVAAATARGSIESLADAVGAARDDCWVMETPSVREAIVSVARREGVDLIVLGLHNRQWWELAAPTAQRLLPEAPCDVLVVREPG